MIVKLNQMLIQNFKGIRELEVCFGDKTIISGKNGSGKSSIFDAFTWLLFGKNSQDKKVFNVKTLDEQGNEFHKLVHSVSGEFKCDDRDVKLRRVLTEKWTRKRGESVESFTGHTETLFVDDVEVKASDFNAKVAGICGSENIFKAITSPYFFTAQKWEEQRKQLLDLVKNVEIKYSEEFKAIIKTLTEKQKTVEDARKDIQSIKKNLNAEITSIPAKIEELQTSLNEYKDIDFDKESADLDKAKEERASLNMPINPNAEAEIKSIYDKISNNESKISALRGKANEDAYSEYNKIVGNNRKAESEITKNEYDIKNLQTDIDYQKQTIKNETEAREGCLTRWKAKKAEVLTLSEDEFKCPTCGRQFDVDKIDEIRDAAIENFNTEKAQKLKAIEAEGNRINERIENAHKIISDDEAIIAEHTKLIEELKATIKEVKEPAAVEDSPEIINLINETSQLRETLAAKQKELVSPSDNAEKRIELQRIIEAKVAILAKREIVNKTTKRISELETELREKSQKLAEIEGKEVQLSELIKFRINSLESAINSKLDLVKFRLFKSQVNGEMIECCEATVNGVPYADVNTAGKINAGLDIIRTLCSEYQAYAPIFIDNAESINDIQETASQQIHLIVDNNSLTIKSI